MHYFFPAEGHRSATSLCICNCRCSQQRHHTSLCQQIDRAETELCSSFLKFPWFRCSHLSESSTRSTRFPGPALPRCPASLPPAAQCQVPALPSWQRDRRLPQPSSASTQLLLERAAAGNGGLCYTGVDQNSCRGRSLFRGTEPHCFFAG